MNSGTDGRDARPRVAGSCIAQKEGPSPSGQPGGSVVPTHGQVHEGEHVELRHDGEAQEHAIQEKAPTPELLVQLPLVQVDAEHRDKDGGQK